MKVYTVKVSRILEKGNIEEDIIHLIADRILGVYNSHKGCIRSVIEDYKELCKDDSENEVNPCCEISVTINEKTIEPHLNFMFVNIHDSDNADNPVIEYYIEEFELDK